ncbi:hypothetical protein DIJ60_31645 [Burkholderia pseudomallei]|nr:hypothetical protein DIJ60_31645 [Burkholderia pseudomallei]
MHARCDAAGARAGHADQHGEPRGLSARREPAGAEVVRRPRADYAEEDYSSLPRRLANAHVRVVARVERKADESPYGACGDKQHTLGRMIRRDTSSPYANAHARLRKWKRAGGLA